MQGRWAGCDEHPAETNTQSRELCCLVGEVRRDHRSSELPPSLATNRPGLSRCLAGQAGQAGNSQRVPSPGHGQHGSARGTHWETNQIKGTPRYCGREGFVETSWRLWAADRSTTGPPRRISHLKQVQHHTSTVPYSKINRHRVPAGRLGTLPRSRGGRHRVHGYATVVPKLCHARSRGHIASCSQWQVPSSLAAPATPARRTSSRRSAVARQTHGVMDRRPCQATFWDTCRAEAWAFLHGGKSVTLRPKVMRARGPVVPIPGRCRSMPTVVERAPSPRSASE